MCEVLRFWFNRGVHGFRVDAIHHLHEDEQDRDNPPDPNWRPGMKPNKRWVQIRTVDQPEVHASIRSMRSVADAYSNRVMIGEAYLPIDQLMAYYGADLVGWQVQHEARVFTASRRRRSTYARPLSRSTADVSFGVSYG